MGSVNSLNQLGCTSGDLLGSVGVGGVIGCMDHEDRYIVFCVFSHLSTEKFRFKIFWLCDCKFKIECNVSFLL